ncbi:MAG: HAMP domain-containing histidine kinase [Rhizobiales bacterium]|nr:HAMP domain-containing histidine kinase [Hyphomicrobiales bacterium]
MRQGSLLLRLLAASALGIAAALLVAGAVLIELFQSQVEERVHKELLNHASQLAGALEIDAAGKPTLERQPADPRFQEPFSGLYWQIAVDQGQKLYSRSIWDESLQLAPSDPGPEGRISHLTAADGMDVIVFDQSIKLLEDQTSKSARIIVAVDAVEVTDPVASFRRWMMLSLGALAIALAVAAWVQAKVGLMPLQALKDGLARIATGTVSRLEGGFPKEIDPLVNEFNAVLEVHDKSLSQARARASDLAHGLKTPLTILGVVAGDLERRGDSAAAADVGEQVAAMQTVVERELSRARLALGRNPPLCQLAPVLNQMTGALRKLPRGGDVEWTVEADSSLAVNIDPTDIKELVGNICDNARKWAASKIVIAARREAGAIVLTVDDDGPGINLGDEKRVTERGYSNDTNGSGLGLTIVRDIADNYGFNVDFGRSPLGGFRARATFPAKGAAAKVKDRSTVQA